LTSVVLSRPAAADLEDILDYSIAAHGRETAEAYLRAIDAVLSRLKDHAELGMARSDIRAGLRSLSAGEHRIYYLHRRGSVFVARILHKSMDVERHL
jgi:toxin ParE1/3/4